MKFVTTLVLAIAALGLGAFVYLDQSGTLESMFGEKPAPLFEGPAVQAITSLTISDPSETRRLEKRDGRWQLTEPVEDFVDPKWIESALETFANMHPKEFLRDDSGEAREGYGLSPDRSLTLTVGFAEGEPIIYQIGDPGPFDKSCYLFPGNQEAYEGAFVVAGDFRKMVETPVIEMVDPVLARFANERTVGLALQHRKEVISMKRDEKPGSRWRLEKPNQFQADEETVNNILTTLGSLTVSGVTLAPEPEEANTPLHVIEVADVDPARSFELSFKPHPTNPDLLNAKHSRRPLVYSIAKSALDSVPTDAQDLREKRLLRVIAADISEASIFQGTQEMLKLENGGAWLISTEDGSTLANQEQGERFLALFNETEIDLHLDGGADNDALYGLDEPLFTIQLRGENLGPLQGESCTLRIGRPATSPQAFVRIEGADSVAAVSNTFLTGIAQASQPLWWKKLEVLNVAFDRIRKVTMTSSGEEPLNVEVDFKAELPDDRLKILRGDQDRTADMDRHVAAQLIMTLGNFNADRWLPNPTEAVTALTTPSLVVSVTSEPEDGGTEAEFETETLRFAPISPRAPAFFYGRRDGDNTEPFLITREAYERLSGKGLLLEAQD